MDKERMKNFKDTPYIEDSIRRGITWLKMIKERRQNSNKIKFIKQ